MPLAAAVGDNGRLVAVDISEPMIGVARQRVEERGLAAPGGVQLLSDFGAQRRSIRTRRTSPRSPWFAQDSPLE